MGARENHLPLFRKVKHSFPAIPPTSFMTIVLAPLVTVPATAAGVAAATAATADLVLFGAASTDEMLARSAMAMVVNPLIMNSDFNFWMREVRM